VAVASTLAAAHAGAAGPGASAKESAMKLQCLSAGEIRVTRGEVGRDASGRLEISAPVVRAVSTVGNARAAELNFTLIGPTKEQVALRSGEMRRQFGLKLRAQNGCNLVYAIWRLEPKAELVVSVKSNPGMRTHAECHTSGYQNIKPMRSGPLPVIKPGESHRLRAQLAEQGDGLQVFADDVLVWSGQLGQKAFEFDGPVGLRTDNVHLVADLCQAPVPTGPGKNTSPPPGAEDVED
jgi:hypothetical protein